MIVYFCENNVKGNHYVGANNFTDAVRIFQGHTGVEPDKVTVAGPILLSTETELKFKVVTDG